MAPNGSSRWILALLYLFMRSTCSRHVLGQALLTMAGLALLPCLQVTY